jgi:AraC family transcriptional regulator of adaptative response/methylated-DNA-[protein]-cysteine methyltransferase
MTIETITRNDAAIMDSAQADAVRRACALIEAQPEQTPSLAQLARAVGLSPTYFQRLFTRATGLSPRSYAKSRRLARVKRLLREGEPVTGALYEAGYGSSRGLYETASADFGMTPATYRKGGLGAEIFYAAADCALGRVVVAATRKGICFVALGDSDDRLIAELRSEFPAAAIIAGGGELAGWVAEVVRRIEGKPPATNLPLDVRATAFQWRVWQALSAIPIGETRSYSELAASVGAPRGQRAVGRACATNPVSIVVPCHRAVRGDGALGGYRWGLPRKERLLDSERGRPKRVVVPGK